MKKYEEEHYLYDNIKDQIYRGCQAHYHCLRH